MGGGGGGREVALKLRLYVHCQFRGNWGGGWVGRWMEGGGGESCEGLQGGGT